MADVHRLRVGVAFVPGRAGSVRALHAVYEKAAEPLADAASETCPACGGAAWIAAEIPLPESASRATA
jgi:hypothetical protein